MGRTGTSLHQKMRRAAIQAALESGQTTCPLCHQWLDYDHHGHPNSSEADEITPYALTRNTSTDPDNWRIICRHCNQARGARLSHQRRHQPQPLTTSHHI